MSKYLVTGVLGFIGSYFAKYVINNEPDSVVIGVNRNSNQKNFKRLEDLESNPRFQLIFSDLAKDDITELCDDVDYIINFAAKTFVDHSIRTPEPFVQDNVIGTFRLLEVARKSKQLKKYSQTSTDEVYGSILKGAYDENAPINPSNPYSAAKAGADALVTSYHNTYGLPTIITRCENNYGPFQHPQKVFPAFIKKALKNEHLPIYGNGKHRRMWLHVEDHCRAIIHLLNKGKNGELYHVAGEEELENIELAKRILRIMNKPEDLITFIDDYNIRPGHDRRYALNVEKLKATGWKPKYTIDEGFEETVNWYLSNKWWFF